jgi:ABC-type polysaccharide/polyol phosphate transport system ATPase subunit
MTASPIIEFHDVWKGFQRHTGSLLLRSHLQNVFAARRRIEKFYALKGVTFQMECGECVAVVGANGAGKSTLLNLVAGLVPPERGTVSVNGRVAALLELGSEFHPDLTGAKNVRLNAALLGTGRKQMEAVYSGIVDFAELADFMEEPIPSVVTANPAIEGHLKTGHRAAARTCGCCTAPEAAAARSF